ncbi:MAG TPA: CDP-diacylglycerol--glycerol-3-phosphate 3-phosphatidyltransferase [Lachnospiraceae bacterium]|nr:CDP-diacylglycerol--glycerol-3-phosphate 3-phosphatidyltransferase [Lachnospiraceae bacterium]HBY71393.1 CDP-diacylglycerol--glycerol-3-phosphate 3-phosphatidyltransferase [Lachnospiraceae bacterium]HCA69072.1 CDP-diacylglycerol--glycerol-3-phosphate 3-phosphatidyltransferase [Lachnospiraceae bacterium]HCM13051.1 CDP-diacylglycerol--glycerol-3-phosphate 3-phosphatidyltransferase [Lachnospiraceae bacterium]
MKILTKFNKKDLWTIPNILCYIRFALVPVFIVMYIRAQEPKQYLQAAAVVFASGLTDFFDGFIARQYNMVTELGKLIDPLADKLTQASLIFVLVLKIKWMFLLLILFVVMQLFMLIAGIVMLKKGKKLNGAKWFGKVSTTVFYGTMLFLVALPTLNTTVTNILMLICGAFLLLSFVLYIKEYVMMYREVKEAEE